MTQQAQTAPEIAEDQVILEEDSKGNRYLPGAEEVVDQEVAKAAGFYHAIKTERVALTAKEVEAKKDLADVCHRKQHLFTPDPDNSDSKIYRVGDLVVRVANQSKEVITTEEKKPKRVKKEKDGDQV